MKTHFTIGFFLLLFFSNFSCAQTSKDKLDVAAFQKEINATHSNIILDVRTEAEFKSGRLAKSINIDYNASDFMEKVSKLDKKQKIYVYCAAGARSARAADLMRSNGFLHVFEMKGGLNAWQAAGLPVEK